MRSVASISYRYSSLWCHHVSYNRLSAFLCVYIFHCCSVKWGWTWGVVLSQSCDYHLTFQCGPIHCCMPPPKLHPVISLSLRLCNKQVVMVNAANIYWCLANVQIIVYWLSPSIFRPLHLYPCLEILLISFRNPLYYLYDPHYLCWVFHGPGLVALVIPSCPLSLV